MEPRAPAEPPRYQDPHTGHGAVLSAFARQGLAAFVIHEAGYLPQGIRWHHTDVRSPFWRLYYNHAPGWHVRCGGETIPLGPDRVVFIAEGVTFDCRGEPGTSHLWLHFSPLRHFAELPTGPWTLPARPLLRAAVAEVVAAHRRLGRAETAPGPERGPVSSPGRDVREARDPRGDGRQRLYHAAAALLHASFAGVAAPLASPYPERLQAILALVQDGPEGDLGNQVLARRASMSVEHFIRWFRGHTGLSPAAYVRRARVRLASQLLVLSEQSIDDVASACGFADRYHLSRLFRQHMGCGPATFRRRHVRV